MERGSQSLHMLPGQWAIGSRHTKHLGCCLDILRFYTSHAPRVYPQRAITGTTHKNDACVSTTRHLFC